MKRLFNFALLFVIMVSFSLAGTNPARGSVLNLPDPDTPDRPGSGMPRQPIPVQPLPHHETGRPSNAANYVAQVSRLNEEGVEETVQLSGLEALMADGLDPLVGNYRLVEQEDVMLSMFWFGQLGVQTHYFDPADLPLRPGSQQLLGGYTSHAATAGDLNGDLLDEQIVTWIDSGNRHVYLATGAMPGTDGRTTSAPAAVARSSVRGGWALEFDGEDDYVDTGDQINLANSSFTVAFWARRHNTGTEGDYAVGQGWDEMNRGLHIGFRGGNAFTCAFYNNDLDTPAYTDTEWHYWACTYDTDTDLRTIYRDGVQVARDSEVDPYQGSGTLDIGGVPWSSFTPEATYLDGSIDEVGIWNVARTQEQIQADLSRPAPDETGLVAYWPFDEGTGTETADASGNGHTGTLVNGPLWASLGDLHLVVRGYDEALWHCIYDVDSGGCLSWSNAAGGILASAPAIVSRGPDQFDVFVIGIHNQVWRRHWEGVWSGDWQQVGDWPYAAPAWTGSTPKLTPPAAVARDGGFDLFRLAPDNTLHWRHSDDGSASGSWQGLGGMFASGPGAVMLDDGRVQVFAVGVDQALWYLLSEGTDWEMNGSAYNWQRVASDGMDPGVRPVSAPTAVQTAPGVIRVFVRGSDDALWKVTYDNGWEDWSKGGGDLASRPAAAVRADGGVGLFAQGAGGRLLHSGDEATWGDLANSPWLPACCLYSPVDAGVAYVDGAPDEWDYAHNIDVTTAHLSGDGREQVVLAYEADPDSNQNPTAIEVSIFDRAEGLRTEQKGSIRVLGPGRTERWPGDRVENPKVTVGDFDDDAGMELALAYTTNTGAVTLFEHFLGGNDVGRSPSWTWDHSWTEEQSVGHLINLTDYGLNDVMSGISVAEGWSAEVYENTDGEGGHHCFEDVGYSSFTGEADFLHDEASSIKIREGGCPTSAGHEAEQMSAPSDWVVRNPVNGHFVIDLFDVGYDGSDWTLTFKSRDMFEGELRGHFDWDYDQWVEADRIPKIVSGDFYFEEPGKDPIKDELAVIMLENIYFKRWDLLLEKRYLARSRFYMFDYGSNGFEVKRHDEAQDRYFIEIADTLGSIIFNPVENFLAAGDLDDDGMDEVTRTWPIGHYLNSGQLVIERALQVIIENSFVPLNAPLSPNTTTRSWRDALAIGHIGGNPDPESQGRDLKEKIIFYEGGRWEVPQQRLQVYEYTDETQNISQWAEKPFGDESNYVLQLVPGDYRGESLRVGPPAFRRQHDIGSVVTIIHAPPKHYDVIDGVTYNVNKDEDETYAMLRRIEGSAVAATLSTTRSWAVDSEYEGTIGDPEGTHLSGSLEKTYGEDFSEAYGSFEEVELTTVDIASRDDFVLSASTGYGVWEYPVYGAGSPGAPDGALSLVFPLQAPATKFHPANRCDNWWYLPRHQLANVWSYPPSGTTFPEEAEQIRPLQNYTAASTAERDFVFTDVDEAKLSRSVNFANASENEYQIGGDKVTFNLTPGGVGVTYHTRIPSFRWSTQRSYSEETLSTMRVQTTNETRVEVHNQAIDDAGWDYDVEPYIYWADQGYMVLDYKDSATGSAFNDPLGPYGGKPDPAFLLPWMNGSDYACPTQQWAFSRDIVVYPPVASSGDTITVTASVRNFSNWAAEDVKVAFYQGDPQAGGTFIGYGEREGAQTIDLGPREAKSVGLTWQPGGYGQQRIYAVIDPANELVEIHDETDPAINNNVGYGLLTMGAFDFVDMGLASRMAFYPLGYTTASGLDVTAYVPTTVLSETIRAQLTDAPGLAGIPAGSSFKLAIYAGSAGWEEELTGDTLPFRDGDPPLVLMLGYGGTQGAGLLSNDLTLYRMGDVGWEEATCPNYESYRFPADNLMAVPVCQTGIFVLSDHQPVMQRSIYLPLVSR